MKQQPLLDVDPTARRAADFYETFRWQTGALLRRLQLSPDWVYVEPCAGERAIADVFAERGLRMFTNDLVPRRRALDWTDDATRSENWQKWRAFHRGLDVGVTNVPFGLAFHIVRLGVEMCSVGFATLLRTTWDEPVEDRATKEDKDEWLAVHPPTAKILMPRAKHRSGKGKRAKGSDSATHAWFIWERVPGTLVSQQPPPFGGPHMTVTRSERDELIGLYGKGAH